MRGSSYTVRVNTVVMNQEVEAEGWLLSVRAMDGNDVVLFPMDWACVVLLAKS